MRTAKTEGFTLIELLVVISIIALLSSIVFGSLNQARAKARDSKRIQDLLEVQKALELYAADNNGRYPLPSINDPFNPHNDPIRVSCWDCKEQLGSWYETNKLTILAPYLRILPSDPLKPTTGALPGFPGSTGKGYWYKSNGQDYVVAIVGTVENNNNIPASFNYQSGNNTFGRVFPPPNDSIMVYSSETAKGWKVDTNL
ncbi:MAG: type II secretion system protein [Candidatus Vogelbacteria bacterium]|nr:type II secretion system protein [Candidatus Vogelbacteria bacterium]